MYSGFKWRVCRELGWSPQDVRPGYLGKAGAGSKHWFLSGKGGGLFQSTLWLSLLVWTLPSSPALALTLAGGPAIWCIYVLNVCFGGFCLFVWVFSLKFGFRG